MLRLIQAEFLKLRRKKFIVLMLLSALFMPLLAVFYFRSADKTVIEPLQFFSTQLRNSACISLSNSFSSCDFFEIVL